MSIHPPPVSCFISKLSPKHRVILSREVRVSLVEKVTSEKRLKRGDDHGARGAGAGVSDQEGQRPYGEGRVCRLCSRHSKETRVAGGERKQEKQRGVEVLLLLTL